MSKHILPMPDNIDWNQRNTSACVGFACAMAQRVKLYGLTNKWIPISPFSIYGYYASDGGGMSIKPALEALREWGALPEYEWDTRAKNPNCAESLAKYRATHPEADASAARFKIHSYREARGLDAIRNEIDAGNPIVLSLKVTKSFGMVNGGYETEYPRGSLTDHAVCIIGYTDEGYLIAKNSWGDPLGNGGLVYIPAGRATKEEYALCDVGTSIAKKAKRIELIVGNRTAVVDGRFAQLDAAPYIKNGRTFLPVRFVAETLGASVSWDAATSTATLSSEEGVITVRTNDKSMLVNGENVDMDVAPEISNNRMMLPIRPIAGALNCTIDWNENTNKATIVAI